MKEKSEFPSVRVIAFNKNEPDPEHKIPTAWDEKGVPIEWKGFSGDLELYYDGDPYNFPSMKGIELSPEAAWFLFAFDTRPTQDHPQGVNKRALKGGGDKRDPDWYQTRLTALGWANDPKKRAWYKNFDFKVLTGKKTYTREEVSKLAA